MAPVGLDHHQFGLGRGQGVHGIADFNLPAVQFLEQHRQVRHHQVDDVLFQGRARPQVVAVAHGLFGPVDIAPAQLRQALQVSHRIVDHLAGHGIGRRRRRLAPGRLLRLRIAVFGALGAVLAFLTVLRALPVFRRGRRPERRRRPGRLLLRRNAHRRRRADIGGRRHGRDVAGIGDIGARAGRPRTARRYIGNHRNLRCENGLDQVAHRLVEPARRIHADHQRLGIRRARILDGPYDQVDTRRPHRAVQVYQPHRARIGILGSRHRDGRCQPQRHDE